MTLQIQSYFKVSAYLFPASLLFPRVGHLSLSAAAQPGPLKQDEDESQRSHKKRRGKEKKKLLGLHLLQLDSVLWATSSPNVLDWAHPPLGPTCQACCWTDRPCFISTAQQRPEPAWEAAAADLMHQEPQYITSIRILYTCNILYFGPQYLHNTTSCTFVFPIFVSVSFITFCSLTDPFSLNISSCLLSAMQLLSGYLTDFLERLSATTDAYKHYKMYVRSAWGRSYNWNVCLF